MTSKQARSIETNQIDIHNDLPKLVARHQEMQFAKPIASHTQKAFDRVLSFLDGWQADVIIDACCGVGESTLKIANKFPNAKVIGIDKSIARLDKHASYAELNKSHYKEQSTIISNNNYILVQADLIDFWRLLNSTLNNVENAPKWQVTQQFILYPNPYPKKAQIGKRWYASAIFPYLLNVCPTLELRSNWKLYLQECLIAANHYGLNGDISEIQINKLGKDSFSLNGLDEAFTPFERKYLESGQTCFKLVIRPEGVDK